jgi:glucose/arabinose dehydrogenase
MMAAFDMAGRRSGMRVRYGIGRLTVLALAVAACAPDSATTQGQTSGGHDYRVVTVAEGLEHPWGMAFLPDGAILVTERPGRLRMIRNGVLLPEAIEGVPAVHARGQGGLLDVALHPGFETNRLVYLSFSKPGAGGATTAVIRGRLEGLRLTDVEEILEADAWSGAGVHFGSRMVFDRDGYLYVSIGDRGTMRNAQDLTNHAGTILRLHDDGTAPDDNPFTGRSDARPEIWAYGIRSPQGLAIHPGTGELWETEHGPRGGDEINLIQRGRNYGWPEITYGINYNGQPITDRTEAPGMEQPLHYWVPSIATSGLAIYAGDRFPGWRGSVFVGGLAAAHLARVAFDGTTPADEERLLEGRGHRIRDIEIGPDGYIYVLVDAESAPLLRLEPD